MNLLDEWKAPEPSPFWDVRMQARLREEQQKASHQDGCSGSAVRRSAWLPRSAWSSASVFTRRAIHAPRRKSAAPRFSCQRSRPEPAVGDLQYLDKNSDLLQNFDALDAMDGDDDADSSN